MRPEIGEFLAYLGTERAFSPKTISAYSFDLGKFCAFADKEMGGSWQWADVSQGNIRVFLQALADKGNAPITRGRKLAVIKSFFKFLLSDDRLKVNPAERVRMPKPQEKEPSYLTEKEYGRLLEAVRDKATKYFKLRDSAIIKTLLGMGLRLSELAGLNIGDISFEDSTIKVKRKGNQERILPANNDVMTVLKRYLKTRKSAANQDPLFLSKRNRRIANASIWHLVRKYFKETHIEKNRVSPHTLRHTFATTLLKNGENIFTIKELLFHRNLHTTERYLHINSDELRAAVGKINLDNS